ncbi:hypothetical protein [Actinacidiphila soli]|uniref:hypothetical protein n=1 Tax=Actinacidiphila soli TaxID=2487275 RepID=UPI000FCC2BC1|nr:hypothetical protein [Actinacidiphila soli]
MEARRLGRARAGTGWWVRSAVVWALARPERHPRQLPSAPPLPEGMRLLGNPAAAGQDEGEL